MTEFILPPPHPSVKERVPRVASFPTARDVSRGAPGRRPCDGCSPRRVCTGGCAQARGSARGLAGLWGAEPAEAGDGGRKAAARVTLAAARASRAQLTDCSLLAAPLPPVSMCPASEVNVTRPKEYWDYESIAVQWGYVCVLVSECVRACVRARHLSARSCRSPARAVCSWVRPHPSCTASCVLWRMPWPSLRSGGHTWQRAGIKRIMR